jgi:hypothetical protein
MGFNSFSSKRFEKSFAIDNSAGACYGDDQPQGISQLFKL